jgi:site-specific DNA-adenine methylase
MQNKVFSALNYVGHKSKIIEQINSNLPTEIGGVFWDMFSGSCVVGLSVDFTKVNFVDNNSHLQNLMKNFSNEEFVKRTEKILSTYGFTNSSRKPRSEYLKDPKIGTCTWQGKTVKNMHLDALNREPYDRLIKDYNSDLFENLDKACCYYILTIYGRNSSVGVNKNNKLVGGVGPLDFGPRAKSKVLRYQEVLSKKEVNFYHAEYSNFLPEKDDFVYLDPPYLASNFKYGFWDENSEKELLNWIDNLDCKWALSNSFQSGVKKNEILIEWSKKYNTILIDKKYRGWAAKGKQNTKKKVNIEVLIKNY